MNAEIGHNNPPPYDAEAHAELARRAQEFADACGEWLDKLKKSEGLRSEEDAEQLRDFVAGSKGLNKDIEAQRKADKAPHDQNAKGVQTAYVSLSNIVSASEEKITPFLTRYLQEKRRLEEAERRRQQEEAERAAREAQERAAEAEARNDVAGQVAAEEDAKAAEAAQKSAARPVKSGIGSASGGAKSMGLVTQRFCKRITDINKLFVHYRNDTAVAETLKKLADRDIRARGVDDSKIPGIEIGTKETAR